MRISYSGSQLSNKFRITLYLDLCTHPESKMPAGRLLRQLLCTDQTHELTMQPVVTRRAQHLSRVTRNVTDL